MTSTPGRLIGGDINKASYANAKTKNDNQGLLYRAATNLSNKFNKNKE